MYLKNIELQGFKSFANKIQLNFNPGITGIVGPNGSGKSNVADAVRWVLGEQSAKQLRGAKMEDVIFAGTENRKKLGFCQVSLTIDNTEKKLPIDYTEVTVARRVYRSGESEYSINGGNCRLKDVHELFFDTGIGKEGYSIIGQGQIDKILSSKPEDRRDLFDEAAGIVKYKKRKELAEKKLQEEKQNLFRVNDILSEIENQLEPLENQSNVAKEFLLLKEQIKVFDINIFISELESLKRQQVEVKELEDNVKKEIATTTNELAGTKEKHDTLELDLENLNIRIDNEKEAITKNYLQKEKLDNQINIIKEQITSIKNTNLHINERIEAIEEKIKSQSLEKETLEDKHKLIEENVKKEKSELITLEEELKSISEIINTHNTTIESLKSDIIEFLNEISSTNNKIQRYTTMDENISIRKSELNQKHIKIKSEEAEINEEKNNFLEDHKILVEKINEISAKKEQLEKSLRISQSKKEEYANKCTQKQQKHNQLHSRYEALKNISDQYEGYNYSIRKIMEQKDRNEGIVGVVADIIKVGKEYEIAIEIALGGSIQHIITKDDKTAKNLVEFLKQNKYGRATFLPLTTVSNKGSIYDQRVFEEQGVINLASGLINYDSKYKDLVEFLLGRVIVVDHIDNGIRIAKKYNQSLRIVTLSGEVLNPGGSITGGSYKNNNNFLGRQRELETLDKNIKELEQQIIADEIQREEYAQKEIALKDEYEFIKTSIQEYIIKQNTSQMRIKQIEEKTLEIQEDKSDILKEIKELENQHLDIEKNITILNEELMQVKEKHKTSEEKINEINQGIGETKTLYEAKVEEITKYKIKISSLEQELSYTAENLKKLNKENALLDQEYKTLQESLGNNYKDISEKEKEIFVLQEQINIDLNKGVLKEEQLQEFIKEKERLTNRLKEYFKERESISERINLLDKELFRINNKEEKLEEQSDQLINYMWSEYEITYNEALGYKKDLDITLPSMKKEVQGLKQKVRSLGDVNVNAIEDYKNLVERHTFLQTQRDDLLEAEQKLMEIVIELDEAMRAQFHEKFKEINEQFNKVFVELFGGGKGFLELTSEEDILEAGIKIIAQPPGKKLQNMMLLSGGERAFTAIALLFAIQSLKPSPFCVLDEIEAALDDANVNRFAEYLHKLSKDTQFIVITHRKGTMESADSLYGITMQEKGISTLVSVNLIENEII
ncbi:condensin subunit Smc [Natranaerovirga pectinivora]|uniref:Chromosome partition protein Smc n=1 Tax=Natranaerovirga pectinivora TaxID=682400 RepID=A0A4R3MP24_9FIRM|nr:chromosome segregation protein SMC [Natranaerovirga pectinivora]TCT16971.1 condensin subunit Smc [Natranaerovirga pectinivora]